MQVDPFLRHEEMISWQPIRTRGRTNKDCMSLMLMHNLVKSILSFAAHDLWICIQMPVVQYPFCSRKNVFPNYNSQLVAQVSFKRIELLHQYSFRSLREITSGCAPAGKELKEPEGHSLVQNLV